MTIPDGASKLGQLAVQVHDLEVKVRGMHLAFSGAIDSWKTDPSEIAAEAERLFGILTALSEQVARLSEHVNGIPVAAKGGVQ